MLVHQAFRYELAHRCPASGAEQPCRSRTLGLELGPGRTPQGLAARWPASTRSQLPGRWSAWTGDQDLRGLLRRDQDRRPQGAYAIPPPHPYPARRCAAQGPPRHCRNPKSVIVVEDLQVAGMVRNRRLARALQDLLELWAAQDDPAAGDAAVLLHRVWADDRPGLACSPQSRPAG